MDSFEIIPNPNSLDVAIPPKNDLDFLSETQGFRSKTSLRLRYEAEAKVIRQKLGSLEQVREGLGLSQRKMCQLLLVDPSAWTRWLKDESKVPPHIWRALQWYLDLESKSPGWQEWREFILKRQADPQWDKWMRKVDEKLQMIGTRQTVGQENSLVGQDWGAELTRLREENSHLALDLERRVAISLGWKLLLLVNTLVLFWIWIKGF